MPRTGTRSRRLEVLPYRIELGDLKSGERRILARAVNAPLARAIFQAAISEHPELRITLQRGTRIIADSHSDQTSTPPPSNARS